MSQRKYIPPEGLEKSWYGIVPPQGVIGRIPISLGGEAPYVPPVVEPDIWTLQEEHDFSHGDTTYTFSGLNGDVDKFYYVVADIELHTTDWRNLYLIPNNDVVSAYMTEEHYSGYYSAAIHGREGFTDKGFVIVRAQPNVVQVVIEGIIYAKSGLRRGSRFSGFGYYLDGNTCVEWDLGSQWVETVTNITSLVAKIQADHINSGKMILSKYAPS